MLNLDYFAHRITDLSPALCFRGSAALGEKVGQPTDDVDGEDKNDQIADSAFVVLCIHLLILLVYNITFVRQCKTTQLAVK